MIDGEIVIAAERTAWTSTRCNSASTPPTSRVRMLAEKTPASFIAFDLLALGDDDLHRHGRSPSAAPRSSTRSPAPARASTSRRRPPTWPPRSAGSPSSRAPGLDGVIAKPLTITYQPDKRVMFKIKHQRTADCVVAGYRLHKSGDDAVGSLMLGLYKDDGTLASVGVIGAFPMATRRRAVSPNCSRW